MKRKMNINRRSAMKTIGALGVASTLISGKAFGQTTNTKATAFALIGDGDHNPEYIRTALNTNIVKETDITIDYTSDPTQLNASTLDGYRLLITARGGWEEMTLTQQRSVQTFIQNGGAALFLHNSTDIAADTFIVRTIIGGYWLAQSEIRPYKVRITNRDHPITKGVNDFELVGEHHYNQYDLDVYKTVPSYVFMISETIDGEPYNNKPGDKHYDKNLGSRGFGPSCPSGWAYDSGKVQGRVCFMAHGSSLDELMNPEYKKLQKNAALWCMRQI